MKKYNRPLDKQLPKDKIIGGKSRKKDKPYILEYRYLKTFIFINRQTINVDPGIWSEWIAIGHYLKEKDLDFAYEQAIKKNRTRTWGSECEYRKIIKLPS